MLALLPPRVLGFKYARLGWWDRLLWRAALEVP